MKVDITQLGAIIRKARFNKKGRGERMTQSELAMLADCDPSFVSMVENGLSAPSFEMLERLGRALNIHPAVMILLASEVDPDDTVMLELKETARRSKILLD